ncbi:MAG TPA: serine hydrolase domain-containing protein [Kofleriaceae bacterium]
MFKNFALAMVVACGASPAPQPVVSPPPAPVVSVSAAPVAVQRFADTDLGYRYDDPDRKAKLVAAAQKIDAAVAEEIARQHLPGLALGVVVDGELVYSKGYGVADVDTKTAPDLDTAYRIGSLTKSFTALGVLSLRDEGVLALEDPLVKWVPEAAGLVYPTRDAAPITVRQLLTHTSGLPREYDRLKTKTEAELVAQLNGLPLENPPGQVFSYSNLGFVMLGLTVAHASHHTFRETIAKRIFEPLGMTASAFDSSPKLAPAYRDDNHTIESKINDYGLGVGGGGIVSTVRDLARYVSFELAAYPPRNDADSGPIRRATIRESHTTGFAVAAGIGRREGTLELDASSYGFGWIAHRTCDDDDLVEHNGAIDSYRASIRMLVHHGIGVIALSNFGNANPDAITRRVLAELRPALGKPYAAHPAASPDFDAAMKRFLTAYNAPTPAALRDMLARDPGPQELEELITYNKLHGTCSAFAATSARSATDVTFTLTCERGKLEVAANLLHGKLGGFSGISHGVEIPPAVKTLTTDAITLIDKWNDPVFTRTFADPKSSAALKIGMTQLHGNLGSCHVSELEHEAQGWGIDATCDRGTAHFYVEEAKGKLTRILVTHTDGNLTCAR